MGKKRTKSSINRLFGVLKGNHNYECKLITQFTADPDPLNLLFLLAKKTENFFFYSLLFQMAWMQQMYSQYLNQYMLYMHSGAVNFVQSDLGVDSVQAGLQVQREQVRET
jgi:hypothetical protein